MNKEKGLTPPASEQPSPKGTGEDFPSPYCHFKDTSKNVKAVGGKDKDHYRRGFPMSI